MPEIVSSILFRDLWSTCLLQKKHFMCSLETHIQHILHFELPGSPGDALKIKESNLMA